MVMRPAGVFAGHAHIAMSLVSCRCDLVVALAGLRHWNLAVVIGVDFSLGPRHYRERGGKANCQQESE